MASSLRLRLLVPLTALAATAGFAAAVSPAAHSASINDDTPVLLTPKGEHESGEEEQGFDKLRDAYYWGRLLSGARPIPVAKTGPGDDPISVDQPATLRSKAVKQASALPHVAPPGATRGGAWAGQGPNPIVQVARTSNTFEAVSGRVSALAIRNDGTIILGAAQGGVWTYDPGPGTWTSRTNDPDTQSVGALAIAPSDDRVVY